MINNNQTTSLAQLRSFFLSDLSSIDIPSLVRIDTNTNMALWNALSFTDNNLKSLYLENMEQSPYILTCNNLVDLNLNKMQEVEFGAWLLNNLQDFPTKFLQDTKIQTLNFPNFKGTRNQLPSDSDDITSAYAKYVSFWNNYWLKDVSLGNSKMDAANITDNYKYNGFWFRNNYFLKFLRLNYPYVIPLTRTAGFNTTPIGSGEGYIYVPDDLVNSYKSASGWNSLASKIKSLSEYEIDVSSDRDSISDSWETILAKCANGTAETDYSVGQTKTVMIDNTPVQFTIVGIKKDTLAAGGLAQLTWMETTISNFQTYSVGDFSDGSPRQFNNAINFRSHLTSIYEAIEPTVKAGIKTVIKNSKGFDATNTYMDYSSEESGVWPPSARELNLTQTTSPYDYFNNNPNIVFCLGATNINEVNNQKICVALRDYSSNSSTNYPDMLRAKTDNTSEIVYANATNPYIIVGFCT